MGKYDKTIELKFRDKFGSDISFEVLPDNSLEISIFDYDDKFVSGELTIGQLRSLLEWIDARQNPHIPQS